MFSIFGQFGKTYKIQIFGLGNRKQILAIFRCGMDKSEDHFITLKNILEEAYREELGYDIAVRDKRYKTIKLVRFLLELTPTDLDLANLQTTLLNLGKVDQLKPHPFNESWNVKNYLVYEAEIREKLLG